MNKEFVPYVESLAMKELGFNEECFGRHIYQDSYSMLRPKSEEKELIFEIGQYISQSSTTILAPLWQQAFEFFEEKFGLDVNYTFYIPKSYVPHLNFTKEIGLQYRCKASGYFFERKIFDEKKEAQLESLRTLIKMVQEFNSKQS